jgi:hypothetical protein
MEDADFANPTPPSADKVARRALVLSVVSCRGFADGNSVDEDAEDIVKRSHEWLHTTGLSTELNEWERRLLDTPFGCLDDRDRINASWLSEAMVVLAWSLGKTEMPDADKQCDPAKIANRLGFLNEQDLTALKAPRLRAAEELNEYNNFIFDVHWRIRDFSLFKRSYDFEALARKSWGDPIQKFGLELMEKDLCVAGLPLTQAKEVDVRTFTSITQERHCASNWLVGYASEDFYEVTTDT